MLGLRIGQAQDFFFDAPRVLRAVDDVTRANLSKAGAFVRRTAKGLIRKGKKPSQPGKPPKSHTGFLRDWILFAYEPSRRTVVIGPAAGNMVHFNGAGEPVSGTVPEVLEYGGSIGVLEWWLPSQKKWQRADLRSKRKIATRQTRIRKVQIAARPYMGPALVQESPKFPNLWADSVRSAA